METALFRRHRTDRHDQAPDSLRRTYQLEPVETAIQTALTAKGSCAGAPGLKSRCGNCRGLMQRLPQAGRSVTGHPLRQPPVLAPPTGVYGVVPPHRCRHLGADGWVSQRRGSRHPQVEAAFYGCTQSAIPRARGGRTVPPSVVGTNFVKFNGGERQARGRGPPGGTLPSPGRLRELPAGSPATPAHQ